MIVVDASLLVEVVTSTAVGRRAGRRLGGSALAAPDLVELEVAQAIRKLLGRGSIDADRAEAAFAAYRGLLVERHGHRELLDRVWELRNRLTAYDAAYVALAEALGCPLLTCDGPLSRSGGHTAAIELMT